MKETTKRILSLILAFVMVLGLLPGLSVNASAAGDTHYLMFATDRHANTSVIGNIINNMESTIGENALEYLALGGDMVGSGNSHPAYNSSTVLGEVTGATSSLNASNVDIVAGIHDMNVTDDAGIVLPYQGGGAQIYKGDDYYVYGVEEYCISEDSNSSNWSAQAQAFVDWANGDEIDKSKVIFVSSHYPLHVNRDDNDGAYYWHQALNTVATGGDETVERNIVFFHGHNHTVDSSEYVYDVGDTMEIQNGSSTVSGTIYYTYATAGYLNQNKKATLVTLTDDQIVLTKYSTSGSGEVMTTVERAVTEVTLSSIAISGTTEYTVGDELALTVTATYSDGSTADVTADATITGYDMAAAGTYTVTATYEGLTATTQITVTAVQINSIAVTTQPDKLTYTTGEELDTTGMVVTATYNNGTTAEITGWYTSAVDMTTAGEKTVTVNYMVDGITYKTTFAITVEEGVAEGVVLESIEITKAPDKTEYLISESLDLDGMVVVAAFSDGSTVELAYKPFSTSTVYGGYELDNFSMYVEKNHEMKVTYTFGEVTCTDTTTINVWNEDFTDDATGVMVHVGDDDYGVTAVSVSPSSNSHVAAAMQEYMMGGTLVAYDITLALDAEVGEDGNAVYGLTDAVKTVTLPIPAGVNNPVVYYVSDDGETVTNMNAVKDGNGNVTFETTHFSTYVIGESAEIELPENETATGSGSTTTTTTKTVYVLTSSISSGNEYLIVNSNSAGSRYALANNSGSVAATGVTVKSGDVDGDGDNETYIELDDAADELWTVAGNYTFACEDGYLYRASTQNTNTYVPRINDSSTTWSYNTSNHRLSYTRNNSTYYLYYSSGWKLTTSSSSAGSIYFYIPTEVEVETTTTVSGTYSIEGEDVTAVVVEGTTKNLTSTLTFTPTSGSATTEDVSTTATYEVVTLDKNGNTVNGDPNGIIEKIENGVVTFTGNYGEALVKVSYTTDFGVVTDYITVTATEPTYILDITSGGKVVTGTTIAKKGVTDGMTLQLGTQIQFVDEDGAETVELPEGATIEWHIPEEYQNIATVDHDTGLVTFKGVDGAFYVTATLSVNGKDYTVGVNISATTSQYSTPTDGTGDFPEYPNEGAIRYDKTGTAVGNFSETGIAQIELSMTGVPYTTGSEIDVVVMLDMTGSMSDNGMEAAELATIAFMEKIVKNEDGSYNENRIAVYAFNSGSSSPYELVSLKKITSDSELATATTAIKTASDKQASGGTPFDEAASKCKAVLDAAKTDGTGNDRQQFCVFMSDGGPTTYEGSDGYTYYGGNASGDRKITSYIGGYTSSSSSSWTYNLPTEYYTDAMKAAGVTVYTVGLLLQTAPSNPSPYSSMTDSTYDSTTDSLTSIGSHYYFCSTILKNMASDSSKYIDIFNVDNASKATAAFESIAMSILQAATDITVEDKITDEYTMIFAIPEGSKDITGVTDDFYIEFGKYALDENHERTTFTSVTKLYLENTNGVLSAKDSTDPVFEAKTIGDKGTLYYWSTNADDGDTGISVEVDGTTYYFVSYGMESGYNMTSGAYAYGTVDSTTNMSEDLVIATPYFVYNAKTRMLYWTVDKLDTYEYTLSYFLYLNNSATEVATSKETDPGPYPTNDHAYITYTNFQGNDCRQVFPIPQLTWNGAQVSYVFYLVNAQGQPINKSGQVVDFANATFITDVYTEAVVWNKAGETSTGTGELSANWLADDLLPDEYEIYDKQAHYALNVYENADGSTIKNQFTISGGTAGEISTSLNTRLDLETTASTVSTATTKVYNTKAGEKISAYGTYTSADDNMKGFDFANTTVAFAVVWQPRLVPDVVVVDYGLDVLINVVQNDILQNKVTGIGTGTEAYEKENVGMNTGVSTTSKLGTAALTIDGNTIAIENETSVRFHQGDMEFNKAVEFYYETPVEFWEGSDPTEGYMYSSVTVIPATTIYYEDEFVDLKTFTKQEDGTYAEAAGWTKNSTNATATQDQDRPGASKISDAIDADNNYGYDSAYETMSQFSMGSAAMATVKTGTYATAEFTFYGTGFDIISMTDTTTGTILIDVYEGADTTGQLVVSEEVDTYYGYKRVDGEWVATTENDPNALYQVPVMKIGDGTTTEVLAYGQYTAVITVSYIPFLDPNAEKEGYDFYLDAIRIYNPTGNQDQTAVDAYIKDGEAYPEYFEVRDQIIGKETFDALEDETISGIVFIDGAIANPTIEDYKNYGPNNELYLAKDQAVAFDLNAVGEVAKIQLAVKTVGGTGDVEVYSVGTDGTKSAGFSETIRTATDMYYDITELNGKTVVIRNAGTDEDAIISITNVKVTYTEPQTTEAAAVSEETVETAEAPAMFSIRRSTASAAVLSLTEDEQIPEETEPETTVPEETEPETTVPEETEPETTVPEETEPETTVPEETEPETTEPEDDSSSGETANPIIELIRKLLGWIFG